VIGTMPWRFHGGLAAGGLLLGSLILASCGASSAAGATAKVPSRHPASGSTRHGTKLAGQSLSSRPSSAPAPPAPRETTGFPSLVAAAMGSFGGRYAAYAEAPTALPAPTPGHVLAARTFAAASSYSVFLYDATHPLALNSPVSAVGPELASFSGWSAPSLPVAAGIFGTVNQYDAWVWRGQSAQALPLMAGVSAHLRILPGHPARPTVPQQLPTAVITWREGRWEVAVANMAKGHQPPVATAARLAAYLRTHALPAPLTRGTIMVTIADTSGGKPVVSTVVTWLHGAAVYQTTSNSVGSEARVLSALRMARSMSPYTASARPS